MGGGRMHGGPSFPHAGALQITMDNFWKGLNQSKPAAKTMQPYARWAHLADLLTTLITLS